MPEAGGMTNTTNKAVRGGSIQLIDCQCGVEVTEGPDDVCVFLLDGGGQETDGFCFHPDDAPRVASLLLPAGTVAVERGRLDRLTAYVAADLACTGWPDEDGANPHWDRYLAARDALRPGDTEAVPSLEDEKTVLLNRDRAERLRLWAEFGHRIAVRGVLHHVHRALVPQTPLVPGDLDLLSEPADTEGGT